MKKTILATILLLVATTSTFGQSTQPKQPRYAVVASSTAYLRSDPSYTSELETQALMGTVVEIVDQKSYWRKISCNYPKALWVNEMSLKELSKAQLDAYLKADKIIAKSPSVEYVLEQASNGSARICDVVMGDILLDAKADEGDFHKVKLHDGREGWLPRWKVESYDSWVGKVNPTAENIVATAKLFLGVPYFWGGLSIKGVDCSGLTGCAYLMNGIILPRNASQQVKCGKEIPISYKDGKIDVSNLKPGDLLFFGRKATAERAEGISHVALYIGDGKIIHSSQVVRINSIVGKGAASYTREVLHARRILGHEKDGNQVLRLSTSILPGTAVKQ